MAPSDGVQPARIDNQIYPPIISIPTTEGIAGKQNYATTISTAPTTPTNIFRHPTKSVIATKLLIMGSQRLNYGIMADECKIKIVGRFLKPRPQIERIRSTFRELFLIKGSAESTTTIVCLWTSLVKRIPLSMVQKND